MKYLYIIIIIIFIVTIWIINKYNRFKRLNEKINSSLSSIDIGLSKRYDTINNLVEVVKGYSKYEKELLLDIVKIRSNMNINELNNINRKLDNNMNKINLLVENYPELKADKSYLKLQQVIIDCEEHLQATRRIYNYNVTKYNELLEMFPSNIIGKLFRFTRKEYFLVEEDKRDNVNVKL